MGFTAGVLLGVVSFDIFPEIIEQAKAAKRGDSFVVTVNGKIEDASDSCVTEDR